MNNLPRLVIGGVGGDSGKTLAAIGIAYSWRLRGIPVMPFKKGPDYIDAAWLGFAAGQPARALDTWMMGKAVVARLFRRHAIASGVNLIEGNRGFYDGEDAAGTHSTAALAKLLKAPAAVLLPVIKMTRTAAAVAMGICNLDPQAPVAGFILNRAGTSRQATLVRSAVEDATGLPVLGIIPTQTNQFLPNRHLGLITPDDHRQALAAVQWAARLMAEHADLEKLLAIARATDPMRSVSTSAERSRIDFKPVRIGVFRGAAFTFYYPDNLEALAAEGTELVDVDPLCDEELPPLDGLVIGGGFPEIHAAQLAGNEPFRRSVRQAALAGMPIWAECGGLDYLARTLVWRGANYPMAGVLPVEVNLMSKPAGHGYVEAVVDRPNPFFATGTRLRGHEFHYSRLHHWDNLTTVFAVERGTGLGDGRDGLLSGRTVGTFLHLHAAAAPHWARGLVSAAQDFNGIHNKIQVWRRS